MKKIARITSVKQADKIKKNLKQIVSVIFDYKKSTQFLKFIYTFLVVLIGLSCVKPEDKILIDLYPVDCAYVPISSGYIRIFTSTGRRVGKIKIDSSTVVNNTYSTHLVPGLYIFKIKDDYGKTTKQVEYINSNAILVNC